MLLLPAGCYDSSFGEKKRTETPAPVTTTLKGGIIVFTSRKPNKIAVKKFASCRSRFIWRFLMLCQPK